MMMMVTAIAAEVSHSINNTRGFDGRYASHSESRGKKAAEREVRRPLNDGLPSLSIEGGRVGQFSLTNHRGLAAGSALARVPHNLDTYISRDHAP
jgi:hypothetical protein